MQKMQNSSEAGGGAHQDPSLAEGLLKAVMAAGGGRLFSGTMATVAAWALVDGPTPLHIRARLIRLSGL